MISILPDIEWSPVWEQIIGSACFTKEVLHNVVGTPNSRQGLNNFASARHLQRSQAMQLAVRSLQAATCPKQSSFTSWTGMTRFHFKRHFSTHLKEKMNMRPNSLIILPRTIHFPQLGIGLAFDQTLSKTPQGQPSSQPSGTSSSCHKA